MWTNNLLETLLSLLLGIYPKVKWLDPMVILFLIVYGAALLSPTSAVLIGVPTSHTQGSNFFSTSFPMLVIFWGFLIVASSWVWDPGLFF